jgi:hypothetical protein
MTDHLRAQELSRLASILAEADAAHEHSLALAARALELDRNGASGRSREATTTEVFVIQDLQRQRSAVGSLK